MSSQTRPSLAVLFDFDGVLANTANVHVAAWERTLETMGWTVDPATCEQAAHIDDRLFLGNLFQQRGITQGDLDGWVRRKQDLTRALLADAPRLFPGTRELVGQLHSSGITLGVVSTTWRENIETVLHATSLRHAFTLVITKEDVTQPKPAPDGYLKAARRLDLPPERIVAFEDSETGIRSARDAGMRVIAVGHGRPEGPWCLDAPFVAALANRHSCLALLSMKLETPA